MPPLTASSVPLGNQIRQANSSDLLEIVQQQGRQLGLKEIRLILLNAYVTPAVIEEILSIRQITTLYEVRRAVCRHRRTPEVAAMRFLPGLFWRDLAEIAADLRIAPTVRSLAEQYLIKRIDRLSIGEKITLARRATPEVLRSLSQKANPTVLRALLENPRLTETTLLPLVANRKIHPRMLQLIAAHSRWGNRYEIRLALSLNPQTPFSTIFELLPSLRFQDLQTVKLLEAHSSIVRHRAQELLESLTPRTRGLTEAKSIEPI